MIAAPIAERSSSQATSAHHAATAKNVDTICARKLSCVNAPEKYCAGRNSSTTADNRVRERQLQAPRDQEDESGRERGADREQWKERAHPFDAGPHADHHRQQVRAGRVVSHLAHRSVERSIVHEVPLLFDVVDEQKMMREIGAAARRQQRRPRQPQQRGEDERDHAGPCGKIGRVKPDAAPQRGKEGR